MPELPTPKPDSEALRSAWRRAEDRFARVVEHAPDGVLIVRGDEILYANPLAAKMLGFASAGAAIGRALSAHLVRSAHLGRRSSGTSVLDAATPPGSPMELRSVGEAGRRYQVHTLAVEYAGAPAILAFVRDTTERHEHERQLLRADRLAALGTLSTGLAHELSSPLSYLLLNLERTLHLLPTLGSRESLREVQTELEEARRCAERLSSLVSDLRVFARGGDDATRDVDPMIAARRAAKMLEHRVDDEVTVRISDSSMPPVPANEAQLEQVFLNLLLNAVQALQAESRPGVVSVEASFDEGLVYVDFVDDGPGMVPEVLDHAFEPFFTTKPIGVGTGLGLPICRGLVGSLGGDIQLESAPGRGTRCRVILPRARTESSLDERGDRPLSDRPPPGPRPSVWIVDDERRLADTVRLLLEEEYDVTVLHSAEEAEGALAGLERPDAILCDVNMPGKGGPGFLAFLRREHPRLANKIAFMSGGAGTVPAGSTSETDARPLLEKPFTARALHDIVRELVHRSR